MLSKFPDWCKMVIAMLKTCRYKIGIIFSILLLLTTLSCSKEQQAQKTPDMRFLLVQGDVVVTSTSGDTKNAATGDNIAFSDTVSVKTGALAHILYGETGIIRVRENTIFSASQADADTLLKMDNGDLLAVLPKLKAGFKVQTPTSVASVKEATFNVTSNENGSRVMVIKGTASVSPVEDGVVFENKSIDLTEGQKTPKMDKNMVALIVSNRLSFSAMEMTPEEKANMGRSANELQKKYFSTSVDTLSTEQTHAESIATAANTRNSAAKNDKKIFANSGTVSKKNAAKNNGNTSNTNANITNDANSISKSHKPETEKNMEFETNPAGLFRENQ